MKTFRNPDAIHAPLASYTHQIEIGSDERILMLSGQVGVRKDGSSPSESLEQLELAWKNIGENLKAAGMSYSDIIKITIYMTEQIDPTERRTAFADLLDELRPCMTLLYVSALGTDTLKVEIDVMASA